MDRLEVIKKCIKDLTFFGKVISPSTFYLKSPEFHAEIDEIFLDTKIKQSSIEAPRGTAKSSKLVAKIMHHITFEEGDKLVVIQSKTRPEAINRLTKIKNILEYSQEYKDLFGYAGETVAEMWREDKIRTKINGWWVTVKAIGTGQPVRGALENDTRITLYCHAKGSLVWHDGRLKPIEETDWVHLPERIEKTKNITVYGNPITESVTYEHRVWAREKLRWYTKDRYRHYKLSEPKWVEAKDLRSTDYWIGEPIDYLNSEPQPIPMWKNKLPFGLGYYKEEIPKYFYDKEFWWTYGLWWGDGHRTKTMVSWSCADKYPKIKERLINFINKYGKAQRTQRIGCETISWCKTELADWLHKQSEGNAIKIPPMWVRQLPNEYLCEIIRGLIDSDGHVDYVKPKVRITSVNLEGLLIIQKMLAKLNIPSWVRATTRPRWETFSNGRTYYSRQKYDIYFRNNVAQLGIDLLASTRYNLNSVFIENGYLWKQVKNIEDNGSVIIHPVTTPDHTYLSPMGKNHNCLDDPDDELNTITKEQMDKNFDYFLGGLAGLDMRNGRVIVIGTPIRQGCIVDRLRDATGWVTKKYQAYWIEDGQIKLLWGEMYSYEWLMSKKKELEELGKLSKFYSEYMCEIVGDEDRLFKKEYLRWYEGETFRKDGNSFIGINHEGNTEFNLIELPEVKIKPVTINMGIDPASSTKQTADYSVTFPIAYDGKDIYTLDYYRRRVHPTAHAEQIITKIKELQPDHAKVETVGYQEMLRDYLRKRLDEEGLYISGLETKNNPRTEKSARLERLHPYFFNRRVWIKPSQTEFVDELMMYPRSRHDDLMDGFDLATRKLINPEHEVEVKKDLTNRDFFNVGINNRPSNWVR